MSELAAALAAQFSSNAAVNALLLIADALIYFAVLAGCSGRGTASASAPFSARWA
jgi:hypothetical protein